MSTLESLQYDHELMQEMQFRVKSGHFLQKIPALTEQHALKAIVESNFTSPMSASTEAVILDFLRPSLLIKNNSFSLPDSDVWKARLEPYRKVIERRIPSVGRVEFKYHPRFKWGGTGWLIAENMVITNRHVADLFATRIINGVAFNRNSLGSTIEVSIDFNEEHLSNTAPVEVKVEEVIYLADQGMPDVAILKLSPGARDFEPIPISTSPLSVRSDIAVIGYPAYDPVRNPLKPADVTRIFGDVFDYKRLSPGLLLNDELANGVFSHDATTLGGSSGSVVLDVRSGQAVGLHFSGVFHEENFAVSAASVLNILAKTNITVNKFKPVSVIPPVAISMEEERIITEGQADSYDDREGYLTGFLGADVDIPLPVVEDKANIVTVGNNEIALKYYHFSVVMNKARRMCFYSAVNINGSEARKTKRPGWRLDPRIDASLQIIGECYGNPPKFSRGHMTRREDPAWGETLELATLGNADSMHVTNSVPQMQPFNAGIWLGLEDYALQNAKSDKMRISVFTGPFFTETDPERYGIRIPKDFWKVIVFIHDVTGKLSATGYTMSQETFLQPEEFIYGQYNTYQTSIISIEQRAGISFGDLSQYDPYVGTEVLPTPLIDITQIKFS